MSVEQNKAISRRIPVEVFEQGRLAVVDEICATDFIEHGESVFALDRSHPGRYTAIIPFV